MRRLCWVELRNAVVWPGEVASGVGRLSCLLSKKAVILLVRPMLAGAKLWAGERGCLCLASIGVVGEFAGLNEVLGDLAEFEVQSLGCAS
jgi:hypothetical protein